MSCLTAELPYTVWLPTNSKRAWDDLVTPFRDACTHASLHLQIRGSWSQRLEGGASGRGIVKFQLRNHSTPCIMSEVFPVVLHSNIFCHYTVVELSAVSSFLVFICFGVLLKRFNHFGKQPLYLKICGSWSRTSISTCTMTLITTWSSWLFAVINKIKWDIFCYSSSLQTAMLAHAEARCVHCRSRPENLFANILLCFSVVVTKLHSGDR